MLNLYWKECVPGNTLKGTPGDFQEDCRGNSPKWSLGEPEESLEKERQALVTDDPVRFRKLKHLGKPVVWLEKEGSLPNREAEYVWASTGDEPFPDEEYLYRVWKRGVGLPWQIARTEHLLIRESVKEDLEGFLLMYKEEAENPDVENPGNCPGGQLQRYIQNQYRIWEYGLWSVLEKDTKRLVGRVGLESFEMQTPGWQKNGSDPVGEREAGAFGLQAACLIGRKYRRKGYALEALQAVEAYGREYLGCRELYYRTSAENEASCRLAERLGMKKSDTAKQNS